MLTALDWFVRIFCGCLILSLIYDWIKAYNLLAVLFTKTQRKHSDIDTVMQQRRDMLNALGPIVKSYTSHEYDSITKTIEARKKGEPNETDSEELKDVLKRAGVQTPLNIKATVEDYPTLQAKELYQSIIGDGSISEIEANLKERRLSYNVSAQEFNEKIKVFPRKIVAFVHGFRKMPYVLLNNKITQDESSDINIYSPSKILN